MTFANLLKVAGGVLLILAFGFFLGAGMTNGRHTQEVIDAIALRQPKPADVSGEVASSVMTGFWLGVSGIALCILGSRAGKQAEGNQRERQALRTYINGLS